MGVQDLIWCERHDWVWCTLTLLWTTAFDMDKTAYPCAHWNHEIKWYLNNYELGATVSYRREYMSYTCCRGGMLGIDYRRRSLVCSVELNLDDPVVCVSKSSIAAPFTHALGLYIKTLLLLDYYTFASIGSCPVPPVIHHLNMAT